MKRYLVAGLGVAACFNPAYDRPSCATGECPAGLVCVGGFCEMGDAGAPDAANPDADVDGTSIDCETPLVCTAPTPPNLTLCGRLWDLETDLPVRAAAPTGARCGAATETGPCALALQVYDALEVAMGGDAAKPLTAQESYVDDCGRYRISEIEPASFGFVALVTDDAAGNADLLAPTFVSLGNGLSRPANALHAYVTRHTTNAMWTTAASLPAPSFVERGVVVPIFLHGTVPVAGVRVTRDGVQVPSDDFYFADTGSGRATLDGRPSTGPNGTALVINSPTPISHSGTGGEPAGCMWPSNLAAGRAGFVYVQRKVAEQPGGAVCP